MNTLAPRDAERLADLASAINAEHEAAERSINDSLQHARRCGELLIEAKRTCEHGDWGDWLATNFPASYRTAAGYMRLAKANVQGLAHLGIEGALKALAEPREPDLTPPTALTDSDADETHRQETVKPLFTDRPQSPDVIPFDRDKPRTIAEEAADLIREEEKSAFSVVMAFILNPTDTPLTREQVAEFYADPHFDPVVLPRIERMSKNFELLRSLNLYRGGTHVSA